MQEGLFLYERGLDPYDGGIFHQVSIYIPCRDCSNQRLMCMCISGALVFAPVLLAAFGCNFLRPPDQHHSIHSLGHPLGRLLIRDCGVRRRCGFQRLHLSTARRKLEARFCGCSVPAQPIHSPDLPCTANDSLYNFLRPTEHSTRHSGQTHNHSFCSSTCKLYQSASSTTASAHRPSLLRPDPQRQHHGSTQGWQSRAV